MDKTAKYIWYGKRIMVIALLVFFVFQVVPALAFNPLDPFGIGKAIRNSISFDIENFFAQAEGQMISFSMNLLQFLVFSPTDLNAIPDFSLLLHWVQGLAVGIATLLAVKEWVTNNFDPDGRAPSEIALGLVKAVALIFGIPLIVQFFVMINNDVASWILHISIRQDITDSSSLKALGIAMMNGGSLTGTFSSIGTYVSTWMIAELFVVALIAISLVTVSIQNGIRFVELLFLMAVGPFLATTKVSNSDLFDVWGREMLAVVFSESVQIFSIHMGIVLLAIPVPIHSLTGNGIGVTSFIVGLGGFLFAMRGPRTLRQLMYRSSGNGGGAMRQVGQIAMMLIPK